MGRGHGDEQKGLPLTPRTEMRGFDAGVSERVRTFSGTLSWMVSRQLAVRVDHEREGS